MKSNSKLYFTVLEEPSKLNRLFSIINNVIDKLGNNTAVNIAFFNQSLHLLLNINYLEHFIHSST